MQVPCSSRLFGPLERLTPRSTTQKSLADASEITVSLKMLHGCEVRESSPMPPTFIADPAGLHDPDSAPNRHQAWNTVGFARIYPVPGSAQRTLVYFIM